MGQLSARSLNALLHAAGIPVPEGFSDVDVVGLKTDSRTVEVGDVFLALRGSRLDGTAYAEEAAKRGAAALLIEVDDSEPVQVDSRFAVPNLRVPALRSVTGSLYDAWHGFPSRTMDFYGITGTNGKSTTVLLMTEILKAAGRRVVSLGTIRYQIGDERLDSNLTTPSTESFFGMLARGVAAGCDAVTMEVSSHALAQDRVRGVTFARALFTNLTQDHLDFHDGFEDYFAAKKKLFTEYLKPDGVGIVNLDAPYGKRLLKEWSGSRLTFSRGDSAEGRAADLVLVSSTLKLEGSVLNLAFRGESFVVSSRLVGALNIENLLAATAFGLSLGLSPRVVARGIAEVTVPGRNEVFTLAGDSFAVVDYAHTPDALERVLSSLRPLTSGRLHVVFGCGGDRDQGKRPIMGEIAERLADRVILTNDNPRSESPDSILSAILTGLKRRDAAVVIEDRRAAIRDGLSHLAPGDCLLVAGKGHEDYQILGSTRIHFSDQDEIRAWAREAEAAWS